MAVSGEYVTGAERIAAERQRQRSAEGWTPEHDDEHHNAEMLQAASQYLDMGEFIARTGRDDGESYFGGLPPQAWRWPWDISWWKPDYGDPIRNLEKAGALIAAEIDRLQRAADSGSSEQVAEQ